jgi:hypothetical protein
VSQVASSPADAGRETARGVSGAGGPSGRSPAGPPVRARSGRRLLPPLIFLAVLAVAAAGVWTYVLQHTAGQQDAVAACASAQAAPPSLAPSTVTVRVLNATDTKGLANTVAADLRARGFNVGSADNDRSGRKVTGVGEIRHGKPGTSSARYLGVYLPGGKDYLDTRATATVDLVVGPEFKQLAAADKVAAALKAGARASASC